MKTIHNAKFSLGRVVATPGALEALENAEEEALTYLQRHAVGDWGDLCQDDLEENELSLAARLSPFIGVPFGRPRKDLDHH